MSLTRRGTCFTIGGIEEAPDMLSAVAVAEYFLALAASDDEGEFVSNMKLQKLVYYAQGFSLALHNEPLFDDAIEAWTHGPVVPAVYHAYKGQGNGAIEPPDEFDFGAYSEDEQALLDNVYAVYGQYSAAGLRALTHEEPPWKNTPVGQAISQVSMREYFLTQITDG
jgi:uncharacterized phage-associated protein